MNKKIIIGISIFFVIMIASVFYYKKIIDRFNYENKEEMYLEKNERDLKFNHFSEEPSENVYFNYFPARLEDFVVPPKMYGLWPYGIKGRDSNSHNEGHPGWDLELKKGSKIYAITDLRISQIHDGDHQSGDKKVQVIEASAMLKDKRFGIVYHSVVNLEPGVVEGARISAGSPLAEVGFPLSENSAMIHFGIFQPNDSVGSCPTSYFSPENQELLTKIVALSRDYQTGKPYASACVGKINRAIYENNFPDRLQYLGGAEPWE